MRLLLVAAAFSALVLFVGVTKTDAEADVDQVVFESTLRDMHDGSDYYTAMRAALIEKEGAAPSQLRSVRPPLEFWVLSQLPAQAWRYAAGAAFAAVIVLAGLLGQPYGRGGGALAAGLAGLWGLGYMPLLYLHAEVWAAPLLLGALLSARRDRGGAAVALAAAAAAVRELYAVAFLALLWKYRKQPIAWAASACLGVYAMLHVVAAQGILVDSGREAPFGNFDEGVTYFVSALSPSDKPLGWLIGLLTVGLGALGLWRRRRDPIAPAAACHALTLIVLTLTLGRAYWGFAYGPLLAAFAPAALRRGAD